MTKHIPLSTLVINAIIILLAISPAFALNEVNNRNNLLVGVMPLSAFVLLLAPIIKPKIDVPLLLLCVAVIGLPLLINPSTIRWGTMLFSCSFAFFFLALSHLLSLKNYTNEAFCRLIKGLIFAYCIVLIIQQFCVLTHLPIFNVSNYDPKDPWKLNSLMSEPSHSARIVPALMFFYISTKERLMQRAYILKREYKNDRIVWWAFGWIILTMGSATAYLFLTLVLIKITSIKNATNFIVLLVGLSIASFLMWENKNVQRSYNFITAVLSLDEKEIVKADDSGSHRIIPSIRGANFVGLSSSNDWLGYGVDADQELVPSFRKHLQGGGGAFMIWINYGFLVALFWWCFSFGIVYLKEAPIISTLLWFLTIFIIGGFNNQILWLVLALSYTYKYLRHVPPSIKSTNV